MTSFQIKISNKPVCQRTLAWLRDHSEVNANGIIQVEKSINGMAAKEVLFGRVDFVPVLSEGTKLRVIRQALSRWRQDKEYYSSDDLVDSFRRILVIELGNLERQTSSFTILSFLNLEQDAIKPLFPFTIQDNKLQLPTWSGLEHLDMGKFWKEVEFYLGHYNGMPLLDRVVTQNDILYLKQTHDFIPITIELKAVDPNAALDTAVDTLDLFRAIINLPSALRLFRRYGTASSPLSTFLPSPIYGIFHDKGEYETIYHTTESYTYKRQTISADDLRYCTNLLSDLKSASPGSLKYFLIKAIKLYQQAFDFTDYRAAYLGLWQLLEVLGLSEPSQGHTQVDNRIACLLGLSGDEVIRDALKLLMDSRNTLVHSGIFPEYADGLVFTLKGIVDETLKRIMVLAKELSTEAELREYYRLASKGDADLINEVSNSLVSGKD